MDIDVGALKGLVRERDLSLDLVVSTIEQALLVAYHHTPGSSERARVSLDRNTGHVTVWAAELDENGTQIGEYDDTPTGFGRIAATTARNVLMQRLREANDDATFDEFSGKDGDLVSGTVQQGRDPRVILVDLGKIEASLPAAEQVPTDVYEHGSRLKCRVVAVRRGNKGPQVTVSRSHP